MSFLKRTAKSISLDGLVNTNERPLSPREQFGTVFDLVQLSGTFADSKTFVDATPKKSVASIQKDYQKLYGTQLDLPRFIRDHFELPEQISVLASEPKANAIAMREQVDLKWDELTRHPQEYSKMSSMLPLPYDYVVSGGRFREIYYWDSYFTLLGLKESGKIDLIEKIIKNFAHLIDTYGFIPNGNRTYYLTRSQPPMFAMMVELLAEIKGESVYREFHTVMLKEYAYWMRGAKQAEFTKHNTDVAEHVVRMPDGSILNRYWDSSISPREERFVEDVAMGKTLSDPGAFYRNVRAGAETGWDFSSRWFTDVSDMTTIRTTDMVPIDLNALLLKMEEIIAHSYHVQNKPKQANRYDTLAQARRSAIRTYLWDEQSKWYYDYVISEKALNTRATIAGCFALYSGVASAEQAVAMSARVRNEFLKPGGLVTTFERSGEQWDAPNGWPPMQYVSVVGLERYGNHGLAKDIATRWVGLNLNVYYKTGLFYEKYDVEDMDAVAGGGEYEVQTGFAWTNGVLLFLANKYYLG